MYISIVNKIYIKSTNIYLYIFFLLQDQVLLLITSFTTIRIIHTNIILHLYEIQCRSVQQYGFLFHTNKLLKVYLGIYS